MFRADEDTAVPCAEPGCTEQAIECYVPDYEHDGWTDAPEHFCSEHAPKHGYCSFCGALRCDMDSIGGLTFEGLCGDCTRDLRREHNEEEYAYTSYSDDPDDDDEYDGWELP